ncbi:hypothetical protein [Actinokineospora enzanensis]|uniref:hypothetical protein n=1 Tax=Actinokineospora enzanensis TaxID=155975 RepID=UPI00035EC4AA|nr:hypothetical protein [Actinokineospora enzanensis]
MTTTRTTDLLRPVAVSAARARLAWISLWLISGAVTLLGLLGLASYTLPTLALFTTGPGHQALSAITGFGRLLGGVVLLVGGLLFAVSGGLFNWLRSARRGGQS